MKLNEKIVITIVALTTFMITFTAGSIILSIPSMGKEFNSMASSLSWIITSYILSSAALSMPFGRLSDIIGRKKIFLCGIIIFAICALLAMFTKTLLILIIIRVINGIGAALIFSSNMALTVSMVEAKDRGKAIGIVSAATYLGSSAGPVLGGIINYYIGWRGIFVFTFILSVVIIYLAFKYINNKEDKITKEPYDIVGAGLYVGMLSSIIYGISTISKSPFSLYFITVGTILFVLFLMVEYKIEFPMINPRLFQNNLILSFSSIASMINYAASFGIGFLLSIYFQTVVGMDSRHAGLMMLIQPVTMTVFSPIAGKLSDKIEPRKLASIGMAITALAVYSFVILTKLQNIYLLGMNFVLLGFGLALFVSPNTNAIMGSVEKELHGIVSSIVSTVRLIGHSISMAIVTVIITIIAGNQMVVSIKSEDVTNIVNIACTIFAVICLFGIYFSIFRGKIHEKEGL